MTAPRPGSETRFHPLMSPNSASGVLIFRSLPEDVNMNDLKGTKHCTIQFKSCNKGHGWLTATNWAQEESCPTCHIATLASDLDDTNRALEDMRGALQSEVDRDNALTAEIERLRKQLMKIRDGGWNELQLRQIAADTLAVKLLP